MMQTLIHNQRFTSHAHAQHTPTGRRCVDVRHHREGVVCVIGFEVGGVQ
jgi:hypothetical protein